MILVDVHAAFQLALARHARTDEFAQPVIVRGQQVQFARKLGVHFLRTCLAAEHADAEREILGFITQAFHFLGKVQCVRRSRDERGGAQILHEHELPLRIARGRGYDRGAYSLPALVQAERAREQSVTEADLHYVVAAAARGGDETRHALRPHFHVLGGVRDDGGFSARAAGRMYARYVRKRHGQQTVRIVVAQVGFGDEGQFFYVFERPYVRRLYARFVVFLFIKRHVLVSVCDDVFQPRELKFAHFFARHRFDFFVVYHL